MAPPVLVGFLFPLFPSHSSSSVGDQMHTPRRLPDAKGPRPHPRDRLVRHVGSQPRLTAVLCTKPMWSQPSTRFDQRPSKAISSQRIMTLDNIYPHAACLQHNQVDA